MPLFTKCLKCGGWKQMPEDPDEQAQLPTGMMMNVPEPPENLCTCDNDAAKGGAE